MTGLLAAAAEAERLSAEDIYALAESSETAALNASARRRRVR